MTKEITAIYSFQTKEPIERPLFATGVSAGSPSPADDYIEQQLNLNEHLVRHPESTFFAQIAGESMVEAGIFDNDILVIDRALEAKEGKIVVAVVDGEFRVKRLGKNDSGWLLQSGNQKYPTIEVGDDLVIWGVVTNAIHHLY